jgi:hypothetical protein
LRTLVYPASEHPKTARHNFPYPGRQEARGAFKADIDKMRLPRIPIRFNQQGDLQQILTVIVTNGNPHIPTPPPQADYTSIIQPYTLFSNHTVTVQGEIRYHSGKKRFFKIISNILAS